MFLNTRDIRYNLKILLNGPISYNLSDNFSLNTTISALTVFSCYKQLKKRQCHFAYLLVCPLIIFSWQLCNFQLSNFAILQHCNYLTFQHCSNRTFQLCNFATLQQYNFVTFQLCNIATLQLYNFAACNVHPVMCIVQYTQCNVHNAMPIVQYPYCNVHSAMLMVQ